MASRVNKNSGFAIACIVLDEVPDLEETDFFPADEVAAPLVGSMGDLVSLDSFFAEDSSEASASVLDRLNDRISSRV